MFFSMCSQSNLARVQMLDWLVEWTKFLYFDNQAYLDLSCAKNTFCIRATPL